MENTIYTKQSGRFALPQFQMLGVLLFIIGIGFIFRLNPWSVILIFVGVALATMTIGIQINFENRTHRDYFRILGFKYGKWSVIPTLDYVSVFVEQYSQDMAVASIISANSYKDYKVSLIVSKSQRFDAGEYDNKEMAFKVAENIAKKLDAKLLDYTSKEPKWIDV